MIYRVITKWLNVNFRIEMQETRLNAGILTGMQTIQVTYVYYFVFYYICKYYNILLISYYINIIFFSLLDSDWLKTVPINLTCVWRNIYNTPRATHSRYYKHFAKHACNFSLILLEPCNFLY